MTGEPNSVSLIALVTGAAHGIGAQSAAALARKGFTVAPISMPGEAKRCLPN